MPQIRFLICRKMEETLEDYINWGVRQEMMVRFVSLLKKRCTQNRFSCWRPARPWREDRTLNSRHDTTRSFSSLLWPNEKRDDIEWRSPGRKNVKKNAWRIARRRMKKAKAGSNGEQKLHARSLAAASFEYVHIIQQPGPGVLCPRQVNRVKRERENFSSFFPFDLNYSCSCVCVCVLDKKETIPEAASARTTYRGPVNSPSSSPPLNTQPPPSLSLRFSNTDTPWDSSFHPLQGIFYQSSKK